MNKARMRNGLTSKIRNSETKIRGRKISMVKISQKNISDRKIK